MGRSVHGLSQHDDTVTVDFDDGSAGRYDLVIGADGIHSTVRRLLFGTDAVRPVGQVAWRFVTACPAEVTTWSVQLGRGVAFLAMPIGDGRVYCYADTSADSSPQPGDNACSSGLLTSWPGSAHPCRPFSTRSARTMRYTSRRSKKSPLTSGRAGRCCS